MNTPPYSLDGFVLSGAAVVRNTGFFPQSLTHAAKLFSELGKGAKQELQANQVEQDA